MGRTSRLVPSSTTRAISTAGRNGARCTGASCACAAAWVGGSARTTGARTGSTHNRRAANIVIIDVIIDQLSLVPTRTQVGRLCLHSLTQRVQSIARLLNTLRPHVGPALLLQLHDPHHAG